MSFERDIDRVQRQLKELDRNVRLSLPEAAEEAAKLMVSTAKEKAPVRTGKLRNGIQQKAGDRTANSATEVVFNDVFYSNFIEYGTRKMRKRPFMRPAFDEAQRQMAEIAGRVVKRRDGI